MTKDRWENTVWDTDVYLDEIDKEEARMNKVKAPPKPNPLPVTNEEWFCSLTTEEKAEFLDRLAYSLYTNQNKMTCEDDWLAWLKKPHKEVLGDGVSRTRL